MSEILLVEDHEMNRDMLSRRLARKGYEVVCAVDGAEAVAIAGSGCPDLMLKDISLNATPMESDSPSLKHELRTPLNQIIGYTELLQEDAAGLNDQACVDDLAKIHSAARRLLDLVLANFGGRRFSVDAAEHLDPQQPVSLLRKELEIPDDPARTQ